MKKEEYYRICREENVPETQIDLLWSIAGRHGSYPYSAEVLRDSFKNQPAWKPTYDLRNIPTQGKVS